MRIPNRVTYNFTLSIVGLCNGIFTYPNMREDMISFFKGVF